MSTAKGGTAVHARAWRDGAHAAVCDLRERWAHGVVVRATRYPDYHWFNVVRVEEDPGMTVEALVAFADEALAGLAHRRVDFDVVRAADRLRADFEAKGWKATRVLWMRHEMPPLLSPNVAVSEVPYDAVNDLRVGWDREEFPGVDTGRYRLQARELALSREVRVFAVRERGAPVAFVQLELVAAAAEITQVYVDPEYRGGGRGTAITLAAIKAAGDVRDLWITADDNARAKELYARLGFRSGWTTMEFLRLP
jgi:ribosomal protein S18 acetylase RimI-like enzyme